MSLENISQVLLRNIEDLSADKPLFINLFADEFIADYCDYFPTTDVHYFTTNFELHSNISKKYPQLPNTFSEQYQTIVNNKGEGKESNLLHDLVIMPFPKSKAELNFTLAMINASLIQDAQIFIVGENKGGIKSVNKLAKDTLANITKIDSARHCSLFRGISKAEEKPFVIDDWLLHYSVNVAGQQLEITSLPGVFSQKELDVGTKLLLETLPRGLSGSTLDFGCGAGVIATFIGLTTTKNIKLTLADVSALALYSAKRTLSLNGLTGQLVATNSLSHISGKFDVIVSNPPFHTGIKTHYVATETFLSAIKRHMASSAQLFVVANSFLKYQPIIDTSIARSQRLAKSNGFTIYHAKLSK